MGCWFVGGYPRRGVVVRLDVREVYLRRLMGLERHSYSDMRLWFRYAMMVLQGAEKEPTEAFLKGENLIRGFLSNFATEKGIPPMDSVLFQMDVMTQTRRGWYRIKTPFVRKRFLFADLQLLLSGLEEGLNDLIREEIPDIRIIQQELAV